MPSTVLALEKVMQDESYIVELREKYELAKTLMNEEALTV